MSVLKILTYPNPLLKRLSEEVNKIDKGIKNLIGDMIDTLYNSTGVGLAAPQVGILKRIIIFDLSCKKGKRLFKTLVNPVIVSKKGEVISEKENCLSVPELWIDVRRATYIQINGLDKNGDAISVEDDGFLSFVLQHEIDHLDGILLTDYISSLKRERYRKKLKKLARYQRKMQMR